MFAAEEDEPPEGVRQAGAEEPEPIEQQNLEELPKLVEDVGGKNPSRKSKNSNTATSKKPDKKSEASDAHSDLVLGTYQKLILALPMYLHLP